LAALSVGSAISIIFCLKAGRFFLRIVPPLAASTLPKINATIAAFRNIIVLLDGVRLIPVFAY
jgi:hypothetical protein